MVSKKILLSGPVRGNLTALYKRVTTVDKSNGPFDALFCVGQFFADPDEIAEDDLPYFTGEKVVPVPTYFIGGYGAAAEKKLQALSVAADTVDMHWLGRSGVVTIKGLSVAFLDGTHDPKQLRSKPDGGHANNRKAEDVAALQAALQNTSSDVDLFLTCEWPDGIADGVSKEALPQPANADLSECQSLQCTAAARQLKRGSALQTYWQVLIAKGGAVGSSIVADLVTKVRPRYHVAGGKPFFFARQPYLNADLGAGAHVTRFIGLAEMGNPSKQKSLHALALTPAAEMDVKELQQKPADTTPSPYQAALLKKRAADDANLGVQDWRWEDRKRHREGRKSAPPSMGRPGVVVDETKSVYVNNLPYTATEEDVVAFFSQAGRVVDYRRREKEEGRLQGFGFVQFESRDAAERAVALNGQALMGRQLVVNPANMAFSEKQAGQPQANCWFCLSNPNADVSLVASIGEECYVACDKGQINPLHVQVLPIEHHPSSLAMAPSAYAEMERYLSSLRSCFAAQGKVLVGFERYMSFTAAGGNHCQVHVMGVPRSAEARAREEFLAAAERHRLAFSDIPASSKGEAGRDAVRQLVGSGWYFLAILPDGSRMVVPIAGRNFPLNFGREVLAALAGAPERADWKTCQVGPSEEEARTEAFKTAFGAFDIMQP